MGVTYPALLQWLKLPAWKSGDREFEPHSVGNIRDCVWRAVSRHHPQEVLVHKDGLEPFHLKFKAARWFSLFGLLCQRFFFLNTFLVIE